MAAPVTRVSPSLIRTLVRAWLLAVAVLLGVTGAMAASAAWQAMTAHAPAAPPALRAVGYEADDHFPGAAALYLEDAATAPAAQPGTTGTIARSEEAHV